MLTFGSLFAGIGGFALGFERAGMTCRWQVENDRFCRQVLEHHWPHVARFGDVREFAPDRHEHAVDLICGGFPCQDLSVAGKRAGLAGERSGLFWQLVRVVSELRPAWLVLENVPGLLSSSEGRDMGTVVGSLADIGYCVCWRVLDSQFFGVAQRRRRVFIVCHSDPHRAASVLFEPEGGAGDSSALRETGTDVAHSLDAGTGGISGKKNQRTMVFNHQSGGDVWLGWNEKPGTLSANQTPAIAACLQSRIGKGGFTDPVNDNIIAHTLRAEGFDAGEDGTGRGTPIVSGPLLGSGAGTARPAGLPREADYCVVGSPPDSARMRDATRLSRALDVCPICKKGPDGPRYRALGNAVTVNVAEWLGRRIVKCSESS